MRPNAAAAFSQWDSTGFSARLKRLRLRLGFSEIADFGRAFGLDPVMLEKWEQGIEKPKTFADLNAFAEPIRRLGIIGWDRAWFWLVQHGCEAPDWLGPAEWNPSMVRAVHLPWAAFRELSTQALEATDPEFVDKIVCEVVEIVLAQVEFAKHAANTRPWLAKGWNGSAKKTKPLKQAEGATS